MPRLLALALCALLGGAALLVPLPAPAATTAAANSAALMAQAQAANPTRYAFALSKGAELRATSDNRAFSAWWQPASGTPKGVIVALHGHASWATDELYLWQPYAEKYGYAVLALQWWFGGGEATSDYYTPDEVYPLVSALLAAKGTKPGTVFYVGYSRASANSYAVAARDAASTGGRYFGLVLSNAGGVMSGYPPNQQIDAGAYGSQPFAGMKWAMYCGQKDPDPTINGCTAMNAAKAWVTKYGASVLLFIDDPTGDHGGFMTNSANVESALATYASVLASASAVPACTLNASASVLTVGSGSTLTALCSPVASAYAWTGGTCAGTSGASCTVTPSATTTYGVMGSNSAGWGAAASLTITVNADKSPPSVPGGLKTTAVESTQLGLSWSAATDNVGVSSYRVYRNGTLVASPGSPTHTDTGLQAATTYTYTVAACDAAGNCSAPSPGLRVTTSTPVAVPVCTLSASPASVAPGGSATLSARCTPAATTYTWTGGSCAGSSGASCSVTPTATTAYTVQGSNAGGSGAAASATVTVTAPAPTNVLSNAEADCLFDWGEDQSPQLLSPRRPGSLSSAPYYYRRYTTSNSYLGVSSADNRLYYVDASGRFSDLGLAATWSTQAGCR
ncbi:MAG: hypothetical protein HY855_18835 [Burkholderiales bacterium]|nr:hypothetical protein [Burkholderiales bacterium]